MLITLLRGQKISVIRTNCHRKGNVSHEVLINYLGFVRICEFSRVPSSCREKKIVSKNFIPSGLTGKYSCFGHIEAVGYERNSNNAHLGCVNRNIM